MENNTNTSEHMENDTSLVADPHHANVDSTPGLETVKNVVSEEVRPLTEKHFRFETWWIIVFLVFALILLKSFIYIKDQKRDGK